MGDGLLVLWDIDLTLIRTTGVADVEPSPELLARFLANIERALLSRADATNLIPHAWRRAEAAYGLTYAPARTVVLADTGRVLAAVAEASAAASNSYS